jgi:hypothetical protein
LAFAEDRRRTSDVAQCFRQCYDDGGKSVIGLYTINTHSKHYSELPEKYAKARPSQGNIPAAYISMTGRDEKYKGGGYGGDLLVDCLKRIAGIAERIGTAVVVLDVLECGDAKKTKRRIDLYTGYGFQTLPSNSMRMFLPVATIKWLLG